MTEQNQVSISELQQQAINGDAQAQFDLALHYNEMQSQIDLALDYDQEAAQKNRELCWKWLRKAAEQGHVNAQYALGFYYFLCSGREAQEEQILSIINHYFFSQNKGTYADPVPYIAYNLGSSINFSDRNDTLVFVWLEKAANQNHVEANFWLGQCYRDGIGTRQNEQMAFNCLKFAVEHGRVESQYDLAICYLEGKGVQQNVKLGMHLCEMAAENGNSQAQYLLARHYLGDNENKDYDLGISLLQKAAVQGMNDAQILLFDYYKKGIAVEKIDVRSLCQDLARKNHAESQYWLARYYFSGGVLKELGELEWRILEQNPEYWRNFYLNKGFEEAFDWAKKAAINGTSEANLLLGFMSLYGIGVTQDYEASVAYFKQAALHDKIGIANYFITELRNNRQICNSSIEEISSFDSIKANPKDIMQFFDIEKLLTNLDDKHRLNLIRLKVQLHLEGDDIESAKETAKNNPDLVKYVDRTEELIKVHKAVQEKEKEMLSFFTHTMRNALATAPEALRQAIKLLGSEVYEKDSNHYKAINKIASLFSSLSLTDCLIDTFKQSISDPEEFKQAWENDHSGEASPKWVLASALRQSLNRIIFMSDTSDLRKLLEQPEAASIKAMRKSFIDEVLPLNVDAQGIDKFYQWVDEHIAYLEINLSDIDKIRFGANQTRFSLLFAIASELILNALRYWDGSHTIQIRWQLIASERYVLSVKNHCQPNAISRLAGTHKGLAFIKRLIELLGEQAQFSCNVEDQFFNAELSLNKTLFDEAS